MHLRKLLMVGVTGIMLSISSSAHAFTNCLGWYCWFMDVVGTAAGFVAREWNHHTEPIYYDITNGIRTVKENIGNYRDEGICGVSATGNTGCDLTTPEEGAQQTAEMEEKAKVIPQSTIDIIMQSEADGDIVYDGKDDKSYGHKGDTFDRVRANVATYIFESNDPNVNADCTCSKGTGEACDKSECAQTRRNDSLYHASLGASDTAEVYLLDANKNFDKIKGFVGTINGTKTISDFVGKMGEFSVYASSAVVDLMNLQTLDLRAQSYRSLIFSGTQPVDLSGLKQQGENK